MSPLWQHVTTPSAGASAPAAPLRRALAVLAMAGLALAGWHGGAVGLAGAVLATALLVWSLRAPYAAGPVAEAVSDRQGTAKDDSGSLTMVGQVVPVWSRQLMVTRGSADEGMTALLGSFAGLSDKLDQMTQRLESFRPSAEPGAMAQAIANEQPALQALLTPMTRAFAQRDAMVAVLGDCTTATARLQQLTKEARELARHTRLVAFNASIEANRGQRGGDGGSQQVAAEVRTLAERLTAVCDQMDDLLGQVARHSSQAHLSGLLHDTTPAELQLEIELRARQALEAMMTALGTAMQGSAEVHDAGRALREQLDEAFTHFQFGDRVAQMLQIVAADMQSFAEWLPDHPQASVQDAHAWLQQLERKYTMDEQRSEHHGLQHVDRGTEIEYF